MKLPEPISERLFKLTEHWQERTGKHPSEALAEYTRYIAANCLTMKLPQREQIALEAQMAECLAREYGVPING